MNILRPLFPPFIRSIIILSTLLVSTCLLAYLIGLDPYLIMEKFKSAFFLHVLRALFRLFGLEMPVWLLLSLVALVGGCSSLHMDDNSAGGQPAAEQPANLPPSPTTPKKSGRTSKPPASIEQYRGNVDLSGHIGSLGTITSTAGLYIFERKYRVVQWSLEEGDSRRQLTLFQ